MFATLHSKTPHVVTMQWLDSDWVVTILSPTSGTSGRLQNRVSVPPWLLHSDDVYQVPSVFPCSDCAVTYYVSIIVDRFLHRLLGSGYL